MVVSANDNLTEEEMMARFQKWSDQSSGDGDRLLFKGDCAVTGLRVTEEPETYTTYGVTQSDNIYSSLY